MAGESALESRERKGQPSRASRHGPYARSTGRYGAGVAWKKSHRSGAVRSKVGEGAPLARDANADIEDGRCEIQESIRERWFP